MTYNQNPFIERIEDQCYFDLQTTKAIFFENLPENPFIYEQFMADAKKLFRRLMLFETTDLLDSLDVREKVFLLLGEEKIKQMDIKPLTIINGTTNCYNMQCAAEIIFYDDQKRSHQTLWFSKYPETFLHPNYHRLLARIICSMINDGMRILLLTHSDYILKEINTLIMLSKKNDHTKSIQKKYGYNENELINLDQVILYDIDKKGLTKGLSYPEYGIEGKLFDKQIQKMRDIQEDLLYGE